MDFNKSFVTTSTTEDYEYPDFITYTIKDPSSIEDIFKPVLYCIVFTCGLVGNALVLWILIWLKKLASVTDIYLLNMAISDLLFIFSLPFVVYSIKYQWEFGDAMCKILSSVYYVGFFSSIFFVTVLSVDRYVAIVHVVFSLKVRTVHLGIIIVVSVWTCSFLFSLPHFIFHKLSIDNTVKYCTVSFPKDKEVAMTLLSYFQVNIFGFIIPVAVLTFCYTRIILNLRNSRSRQKKYAVKLIFIVVAVFFLFWTPYNIVIFLKLLEVLGVFDSSFSTGLNSAMDITQTIAFVHCCLNPIIYSFAGENFQKHVFRMFSKLLKCMKVNKVRGSFESSVIDRASGTIRDSRSTSFTESVV
ncbi:PREDICTED: C-C chemokine receptor type 8-like [Nanorana parkeri]|uniref:C-C chemokine receptor type 8-like n=1 Tax=Nanorana parkeri TaxID=125878 RepID=UPI0008545283|nr:PREDICTED: C-C chemokine receptor type 8-like [Nanorana parkeri]